MFDVIVDVGPNRFPFRQDIAFERQRLKSGSVDLHEERGPRTLALAEFPVVQAFQQLFNGFIQGGNREELPMPQRRQDPAFHDAQAFSTLALSRGLRGRAGRTPMP